MSVNKNLSAREDLIYWAGAFDHYGSIYMRFHARHNTGGEKRFPQMAMRSKDKEHMDQLQALIGGHVRVENDKRRGTTWYRWDTSHSNARDAVIKLAPFMKLNKEVIYKVIRWRATRRHAAIKVADMKPKLVLGPAMSKHLQGKVLVERTQK